jgi:hypothetical protein
VSEHHDGSVDIQKVRHYFDTTTNGQVTDEEILAALDWFRRDSQRHMLAARSIVRSRQPVDSDRSAKGPA